MFDFSNVNLARLVIHKVGNRLRDEGIFVSPTVYTIQDADVEELLLKYFLSSFKNKMLYKFFDEIDVGLNEIYKALSNIFINPANFHAESVNILKHIYEKSSHPQIRGGGVLHGLFYRLRDK